MVRAAGRRQRERTLWEGGGVPESAEKLVNWVWSPHVKLTSPRPVSHRVTLSHVSICTGSVIHQDQKSVSCFQMRIESFTVWRAAKPDWNYSGCAGFPFDPVHSIGRKRRCNKSFFRLDIWNLNLAALPTWWEVSIRARLTCFPTSSPCAGCFYLKPVCRPDSGPFNTPPSMKNEQLLDMH